MIFDPDHEECGGPGKGAASLETTQIQRLGERECYRSLFMFDHNATIAQ
jgi:hypothetical protein